MSYFKVLSRHWLGAGVSFRFCETQISVARKALHVDFAPISVRQSNIAVLSRRTAALTCAYRGFHFPSTPIYIFICCLFNNTVSPRLSRHWCGSRELPANSNMQIFCMHTRLTAICVLKEFLKKADS